MKSFFLGVLCTQLIIGIIGGVLFWRTFSGAKDPVQLTNSNTAASSNPSATITIKGELAATDHVANAFPGKVVNRFGRILSIEDAQAISPHIMGMELSEGPATGRFTAKLQIRELQYKGFGRQPVQDFLFQATICKNEDKTCSFGVARAAGRIVLKVTAEDVKPDMVFDLGKIYLTRQSPGPNDKANCAPGQAVAGIVVPTKPLLAASAGKKYFLVVPRTLEKLPEGNDNKLTREGFGKYNVYTKEIALSAAGSAFQYTLPDTAENANPANAFPYLIECNTSEDAYACWGRIGGNRNAIPNLTQAPGLIRLVGEKSLTLGCDPQQKLFAHAFPKVLNNIPTQPNLPHQNDSAIPEEIVEGVFP